MDVDLSKHADANALHKDIRDEKDIEFDWSENTNSLEQNLYSDFLFAMGYARHYFKCDVLYLSIQ